MKLNYEIDNDDLNSQDAISMMHPELIIENIKIQIESGLINPYKVNYLKDYIYQYKFLSKEYQDESDTITELNSNMNQTLEMIINSVAEKFGFEVYLDDLENPKNLAKALYKFFVLKYEKNMIDFIANYIIRHKKDIINTLKAYKGNTKKSKNVTSLANKMLYSPNEALILSNINFIITEIIPSLDLGITFLEYLDTNNATLATIEELFDGSTVSFDEDLYEMFISPITDKESGYSTIISEVTVELANIYNKKESVSLTYEENDDEEEDAEEDL